MKENEMSCSNCKYKEECQHEVIQHGWSGAPMDMKSIRCKNWTVCEVSDEQ